MNITFLSIPLGFALAVIMSGGEVKLYETGIKVKLGVFQAAFVFEWQASNIAENLMEWLSVTSPRVHTFRLRRRISIAAFKQHLSGSGA